VLQLNTETIRTLLHTKDGRRWAFKMFAVVALLVGLGAMLVSIPSALGQPTTVERVDAFVGTVRGVGDMVTGAVRSAASSLARGDLQALPDAIASAVQRGAGQVTGQLDLALAGLSTQRSRADQLLAQSSVSAEQISAALDQASATPEQLSQLLDRAGLSDEQVDAILNRASISREQLDQARAQAAAVAGSAAAQLQVLRDRAGLTDAQLDSILNAASLSREQFAALVNGLGAAPEQVGDVIRQLQATPEQLAALGTAIREEILRTEPPLGVRLSRIIALLGMALTAPLVAAANWLLFALVLLLVARVLGGSATLPQHLAAAALAAAPLVLSFIDFAPPLSSGIPVLVALAIQLIGRVLALIGLVWSFLILIRTLSVAHAFSLARAGWSIVLTAVVVLVVAPIAALLATGFLLAG
jgi:hypothetical protein